MITKYIYKILPAVILILGSCSKPEVVPDKTHAINASFTFSQTQVWPQRYQVIFGAFGKDTLTPSVYYELTNPGENITTVVSLDKVSETATLIKLYIANQAKQPLYTLSRQTIPATSSPVELPKTGIKLLTFNRMQTQVFNNCIVCHGGSSGTPAAGLNLTASNSFASLVGQISTNSTKKRVEPGSVSGSFIIDVLSEQQTKFIHAISNSIEEEDIELIEYWIEAGAINN